MLAVYKFNILEKILKEYSKSYFWIDKQLIFGGKKSCK